MKRAFTLIELLVVMTIIGLLMAILLPVLAKGKPRETAYILSGEWEEDGQVYTEGTLFHAPRGIRHGPHVARTEVVSLTIFDGPLTVD